MRRLLVLWLAFVPVQPALAAIAPPPPAPAALCTSHGCCARPRGPRPAAAARASCHGSTAGYIVAACTHDPVMAAPAGVAPHLASRSPRVLAPAADTAVPDPAERFVSDAFPGVDPPPPRASAD
jgi:hypothetical protein